MSGGGTGAPRRREYWVCRCKEWNWCDRRATCKSCGKEAPAWAKRLRAAQLPQADGEGFVQQPRGRSHQRAARRAGDASRTASAASTVPSSAPNSWGRPRGGAKPPPWREERVEQPEEPASSLERRLEEAQARISSLREAVAMEETSEAFQREARAALLAAEASAERAEAELREAQRLGRPPHAVLHGGANAMQKVEKQIATTRAKREQAVQRADSLRGRIAAIQEELTETESEVEDFDSLLVKLEESKAQTVQQALQRAIEVCGGQQPLETAVGGLVTQVSQLGELLGRNADGVAPRLLEIMGVIATQSAAISDMLHPAAPAAAASRWADGLGGGGLAVDDEEGAPAPAAGASAPAVQRPPAEAAGQQVRPCPPTQRASPAVGPYGPAAARGQSGAALGARPQPGKAERGVLEDARDEHEDGQARVGRAVPASEKVAGLLRACFDVLDVYGNTCDRASEVLEAYIARGDAHLIAEDMIHKAGPTSSVAWGRTVTGEADGELRGGRVTAGPRSERRARGAALGLRLRRAEPRRALDLDPPMLVTDCTPHSLAGWLHSGERSPPIPRGALEATAPRQASAAEPWAHRDFPVEAAVLALGSFGWHFRFERCLITDVRDMTLMGLRALDSEASLGARRASGWLEMRKLASAPSVCGPAFRVACREFVRPGGELGERQRSGLVSHLTNAHWPQARLRSMFECPMLAAPLSDSVSPALARSAVRVRPLGVAAGEVVARRWWSATPPLQGPRTDAMSCWRTRRPSDVKPNGNLCVDGSSFDQRLYAWGLAGWAFAQCDDDGSLVAGAHVTVRRALPPQQAARGGEGFAVWKNVIYAGPAVEEVPIGGRGTAKGQHKELAYATGPTKANAHPWRSPAALGPGGSRANKVTAHGNRQAVIGGLRAEAQWRGALRARGSAELGARLRAEAAVARRDIAEKDSDRLLASDEGQWARFADLEEQAEQASAGRPTEQQPHLECFRSAASAVGLSFTAAGAGRLGHSLAHALCDAGEEFQEQVACSRRGAYMVLGGRAGGRPKLKEPCIGTRAIGQRSQRRLWPRGLHPGGRPRGGVQQRMEKGAELPALRLQGPLAPPAQEGFLAWLGIAIEEGPPPAGGSSAAAPGHAGGREQGPTTRPTATAQQEVAGVDPWVAMLAACGMFEQCLAERALAASSTAVYRRDRPRRGRGLSPGGVCSGE
ncbi:unnamed protein product [Prorocentrum cordatum]|uniref:Uncharacterized protein n=1 Tax=Prorocentrum cordatum TaxID=2364126 RepID=A0ABN9QN39_9DINO|nr:unnamed protein product [Polarella glacialis]